MTKMSSITGLTIVLTFVSLLISSIQFSSSQTSSWTTYTDPSHGIKIVHPSDWQVDIGEVVDVPGDYITSIAGIYPIVQSEDEDILPVYVQIGIDNSVQPISIEQYLDDVINLYMSEDSGYENFEIVERGMAKTTISGQKGYRLVFTAEVDGQERKFLETGLIHNDKPYFITYDAEKDLYDKYLPTVEQMITTFTIAQVK